MPLALSSGATETAIRIEERRGSSTVSVQWPASAASECARRTWHTWFDGLGELLSGGRN